MYIDLDPLKLDKRVVDACENLNINYDYDTEKNICNIDFDSGRKLLKKLGGQMLTVHQYWELYNEAIETDNKELLHSLTSDYFTEPLDRIYFSPSEYIDNPTIISEYRYDKAEIKTHPENIYRPGWFLPENNIDMQTGLPIKVNNEKNTGNPEWKFWTADLSVTRLEGCFVLRGYVTSVGRPSLDLGIPSDSRQPKQMLRECRIQPVETEISTDFLLKINDFLLNDSEPDSSVKLEEIKSEKDLTSFLQNEDNEINILKELLFDKIGYQICTGILSGNDSSIKLSYSEFAEYIINRRNFWEIDANNKVTFVIGHRNPDTDTVISSILEAYRNTLLYPKNTYIPIIQSKSVPAEVRELLGNEICDSLISEHDDLYLKALESGLYDYIFVDHNYQQDAQKSVTKIIDHHEVSETAKAQRIPKTLMLVGSTTALVTLKFLGSGFTFDSEMLRMICGAMLMDTENKVEHKMTTLDSNLFSYIEQRTDICTSGLYKSLSNQLICETNIRALFHRDYKDFLNYGFAVIKTKDENIEKYIPEMLELAKANNKEKAYPFTVIKIVIYNHNIDVIKELMLFEKSTDIPDILIRDVKEVIKKSLLINFSNVKFTESETALSFSGIGKQLSRKRISTAIETVVRLYDEFKHIKSIDKWVSRDFLKINNRIKDNFPNIKYNPEDYINYINYREAKELTAFLEYEMLSLSDYWKVLKESKDIGDIRMEKSLKNGKYIEFLDTTNKNAGEIPEGSPALFFEGEVNPETGLPNNLLSPDHYGLPLTWRYWSDPDKDNTYIFTRSHIFLLDTPCLDAKTTDRESFPNLLIRPVSKKPPNPEISITINNETGKLNISQLNPYTNQNEIIYEGSDFTE